MVGQRKKKYKSGEGAEYISRTSAMKKLQLSLKDFRKLCILKGIYPREPRNRRKAQHGDTALKTLYAKKDIQFLMHEPIIWKLREWNTHGRKVIRAQSLKDFKKLKKLKNTFPQFKLDHIVKERYPTFISALRDLDDCLTMCFLYASFPMVNPLRREHPAICRKLSFEFLHAVIAGQWLRKVFVSIKGYYFQAEIKGQTVTWIMPHQFGFQPRVVHKVDFNLMSNFVQFYIVLLGFVNFRLYHSLNMYYPPKLTIEDPEADSDVMDRECALLERVAALNIPLKRSEIMNQVADEDADVEIDVFNTDGGEESLKEARREAEKLKRLKTLFKGLKVFVNREVPREPVVFTLRCFGADVSWDKTLMVGATFAETDETITHQIIDRPTIDKQYISRYYVQPQWIFDSVNSRVLLPVERYFLGVTLPPHLSPFVPKEKTDEYVPPEQLEMDTENNQDAAPESSLLLAKRRRSKKKKQAKGQEEDNNETQNSSNVPEKEGPIDEIDEAERLRMEKKKKMAVKVGRETKENPRDKKTAEWQEFKLREKMVQGKYRSLYRSMTQARANKRRDRNELIKKRVKLEKQKKHESEEKS